LLVLVDAPEVGKAKAEMQVALVQVRLRAQAAKDLESAAVSERLRKEAEAALREAEIRLLGAEQALVTLGFSPPTKQWRTLSAPAVAEQIQALGFPTDLQPGDLPVPGTLLPVVAPRDGVVLQATLVAGEAVEPAKPLFIIADPSQLRLTLHVHPADAGWVKAGQEVRFRPDGHSGEASGRVTWVGASADETTRRVPVWAEVPNLAGALRASTLGTGRIVIREEPDALLVPASSLQEIAGVPVVFVRDRDYLKPDGPKAFHVRPVVVGARNGNDVEVVLGLAPGEVVATKGTAFLAEELRKSLSAAK
jgi:cobalt-zinc-cadmium efflux system membrane fusion protein